MSQECAQVNTDGWKNGKKKTDGEVEHPGGKVDNSTEMTATE